MNEIAAHAAEVMHQNWHFFAIAGILVAAVAVAVMGLVWDYY